MDEQHGCGGADVPQASAFAANGGRAAARDYFEQISVWAAFLIDDGQPPPKPDSAMLMDCPDCGRRWLSKRALLCPKCGFHMQTWRRERDYRRGIRVAAPLVVVMLLPMLFVLNQTPTHSPTLAVLRELLIIGGLALAMIILLASVFEWIGRWRRTAKPS